MIRLAFIFIGHIIDANFNVKYSDVDYIVFSDAARLSASGLSPYLRATYRYTPILAWLLVPTIWFADWGKVLFTVADAIIGVLLVRIMALRGIPEDQAAKYAALFLLNPFAINVSTRGNADSVVCAVVLSTLYCLLRHKITLSAILFGVAVHMKIYPVIYALPIVLFLNPNYLPQGKSARRQYSTELAWIIGAPISGVIRSGLNLPARLFSWVRTASVNSPRREMAKGSFQQAVDFFSPDRIGYGLVSLAVFFSLGALCYVIYGWPFVRETYLYHVSRTDNRHNFSPYFYDLYLRWEPEMEPQSLTDPAQQFSLLRIASILWHSRLVKGVVSFFPQFGTILILGARYSSDLPFAMFVQTWAFVAWNKVITAQYFHWYLALAPLVLHQSLLANVLSDKTARKTAITVGLTWLLTELHWNFWAYFLEHEGQATFLQVWLAGLMFFAANVLVIRTFIVNHILFSVFKQGNIVLLQDIAHSKTE